MKKSNEYEMSTSKFIAHVKGGKENNKKKLYWGKKNTKNGVGRRFEY